MSRYLVSALALLATLAPSASFAYDGDASTSIRIFGIVPVICRADLQETMVPTTGGSIDLGQINEFCNAPGGYRVVVNYSGSGDLGALVIDGQTVQLDGSGRAVLVNATGPAIHSRHLDYEPGADSITALHVTIETDMV
jgi:hypothetical protein